MDQAARKKFFERLGTLAWVSFAIPMIMLDVWLGYQLVKAIAVGFLAAVTGDLKPCL